MPKISVITVTFNAEETIERTIQSVQNQTYDDFEYILIDGNSKDKTLEIAGKYKDFIKKWISEPDKSMYDGMNKGILLAQGEYIIFLNAGDIFASDDVLKKAAKNLGKHDIVYGNIDIYNSKTGEHNIKKQNCMNKAILCSEKMYLPTEFIKRNFLENLGGFDLRFFVAADYEFNLRAILHNKATIKYIDEVITTISERKEDVVKSAKKIKYKQEKAIIQKMYFSPIAISINAFLYKHFKSFFKIGD